MTRSDKWKQRAPVMVYRAFKDECRLRRLTISQSGSHILAVIPMPRSWSKKKKAEYCGQPHQAKPDKDNIEKAILDALYDDDAHIWDGRVTKIWGYDGAIVVDAIPEPDLSKYAAIIESARKTH